MQIDRRNRRERIYFKKKQQSQLLKGRGFFSSSKRNPDLRYKAVLASSEGHQILIDKFRLAPYMPAACFRMNLHIKNKSSNSRSNKNADTGWFDHVKFSSLLRSSEKTFTFGRDILLRQVKCFLLISRFDQERLTECNRVTTTCAGKPLILLTIMALTTAYTQPPASRSLYTSRVLLTQCKRLTISSNLMIDNYLPNIFFPDRCNLDSGSKISSFIFSTIQTVYSLYKHYCQT